MLFIPCQKLFLFLTYSEFLSWLFGYVEKRFDKKALVYDVTNWATNNYYIYIAQYLKKRQPEKSYTKCGGEASPRPFYEKLYLCVSLNQRSEIL